MCLYKHIQAGHDCATNMDMVTFNAPGDHISLLFIVENGNQTPSVALREPRKTIHMNKNIWYYGGFITAT